MAATLKLHLKKEGCQLGKKYVKTKLSHLHLDDTQEGEVKDRRESTSPKLSALNSPLSSSGNKATPGKCVIKKILVDLRPILDNIMDPLDSQEEMLEENPQDKALQHPSSDPCDSSGEDFLEGEDGTSGVTTTDGAGNQTSKMAPVCSKDNEGGGGNQTSKMAPVCSKDKGIHKVISFPSTPELIRVSKFNGRRVKTPRGTPAELGEPKRPQKNISPAMLILEPQFESPMFVPRICPQQCALLDTESSAELPRAPSPDFQLPTQLLLQRLQETTTSSNHLLITQVLSSLQEELLVRSPSSSDGEKQNSSSEASWNKPSKSGPADPNQGKEANGNPGATQRRLRKSTWCCHQFIYGAGLGQAAPHL
ncbi:uncharacterized protein LOC123036555 [Varanus komodoensis]|uniref:uncharacterized protein LOC123036555 n=1 Tax=Varanus komodoensis TaxID=61221 RepID=UPI001CF7AC92|nr:uncharacterized protein LOC123036555 [Varanus komodoensis]XP_044311797.1 uncharacterized protein LOC123036555 [Varanus komodoensis]